MECLTLPLEVSSSDLSFLHDRLQQLGVVGGAEVTVALLNPLLDLAGMGITGLQIAKVFKLANLLDDLTCLARGLQRLAVVIEALRVLLVQPGQFLLQRRELLLRLDGLLACGTGLGTSAFCLLLTCGQVGQYVLLSLVDVATSGTSLVILLARGG